MGCQVSCVIKKNNQRLDEQYNYLWDGRRGAFNAFIKSHSSWPYDRNKYVVVRKLYTEWIFEEKVEFSLEKVYAKVKRYGDIEALEFIDANKHGDKRVAKVYITFKYGLGAIQAYIAHQNTIFKHPFFVCGTMFPVCAWEQPEIETIIKNRPEPDPDPELCCVNILNDDCLLEIFKYLDVDNLITVSEVCERFKIILHQHVFQSKVEPSVTINLGEFSLLTYRWSRCFVRYVTHLKIVVECVKGSGFRRFVLESAARLIASIFGNKIKELTVFFFDNCDSIDLEPILKYIENLTIFSSQKMVNIGYNFEKSFRFKSKVKTFTFYFPSNFGANLSIANYDRLIMLRLSEYMCSGKSDGNTLSPCQDDLKLSDFFAANPKITCLQLSLLNSVVLENIMKYLPDLEYLHLLKLPNGMDLQNLEKMKRFQCVEVVERFH